METTEKTRNLNIDCIKFICAFGVICIHTQNSTYNAGLIGDFFTPLCVPFFFLSALVFFISGLKEIHLASILNKIWKRIVIPYLAWTFIYSALILFKHYVSHQDSDMEWWRNIFFGSSAVQLYYIPKMLIMQGGVLGVVLIGNEKYKNKGIGLIVFLLSFAWLFVGVKYDCFGFDKSDYVVMSIYIGAAFGIAALREKQQLTSVYSILGGLLFILLMLLKFGFLKHLLPVEFSGLLSIMGGLSLCMIAFTLPSFGSSKKLALIFGLSYGIYLSHVLFLESFEFGIAFLKINLFYDLGTKLIFSLAVLGSSIVFLLIVKKVAILKQILLGE